MTDTAEQVASAGGSTNRHLKDAIKSKVMEVNAGYFDYFHCKTVNCQGSLSFNAKFLHGDDQTVWSILNHMAFCMVCLFSREIPWS